MRALILIAASAVLMAGCDSHDDGVSIPDTNDVIVNEPDAARDVRPAEAVDRCKDANDATACP